jgi:hypothetical protein
MAVAALTWKCGANGPKTVDELRKTLTAMAKKKTGKALIADKFTKDHVFAGHSGDPLKMATMLAKLRKEVNDANKLSSLLLSSLDKDAQVEVLNWIAHVPARGLTYSNGTWTVAKAGTAVKAAKPYKFATVSLDDLKGMNRDDVVKKSRKWLTQSMKTPAVACWFGADGTPVIYHLDF